MFICDGKTKTLQQYETLVNYVIKHGDGETAEGIFFEEEKFRFDSEIKKRNLPAFNYDHAVEHPSIVYGKNIISKNELCSTSSSRAD